MDIEKSSIKQIHPIREEGTMTEGQKALDLLLNSIFEKWQLYQLRDSLSRKTSNWWGTYQLLAANLQQTVHLRSGITINSEKDSSVDELRDQCRIIGAWVDEPKLIRVVKKIKERFKV